MNGRFLINRGDAKVMGVAAGLADYTGIDPTVVRLGFIAATLVTGPTDDLLLFARRAAGAAPIGASRSFRARRADHDVQV